jgi:hypothetical protein
VFRFPFTVFSVEDIMMRLLTGVLAGAICLVLVGQGVGQDEQKKPDLLGKVKEVKKAEEGAKGLGTITITTFKKGEDSKDVTLKVGKKTVIEKAGKGKDAPGTAAEFSDIKEGGFVRVWLAEGKEDVAKKIVIGGGKGKKKKDAE